MRSVVSLFAVLLIAFLQFASITQAQSLDLSQIRTMGTAPPEITAVTSTPSYLAVGEGPAGSVETLGGKPSSSYRTVSSSAAHVVGMAWAGVITGVVVGVSLI